MKPRKSPRHFRVFRTSPREKCLVIPFPDEEVENRLVIPEVAKFFQMVLKQ